jgi:predicted transcriptional regulator
MTPATFTTWRQQLSLSRREAADALGVHIETIANYESGRRRDTGKPVIIPRSIALACSAVAMGLPPYGEISRP